MQRLNVVSGCSDRELDELRGRLRTCHCVGGLGELLALLREQTEQCTHADVLDLIGHSRDEGFLVLGGWIVDDSPQTAATFSELLRPFLLAIGVSTIRVLGCSTATTLRAREALRRIAFATRCNVLGTRRFITNEDYAPSGFASDEALLAAVSR